tara:strand:+ start:521 stop:1486 length:966 start_codon:yes stop_codon:yes gene_type:complete
MPIPKFWEKNNILSLILTPLSFSYELLYKLRKILTKPTQLNIPVVCIGNITVGGAGKTPTAMTVAKYFLSKGLNPHFLSRGYGRKLKGTIKVNHHHSSLMVGDEPILLSKIAPTWVCDNKLDGAKEAQKNGADVLIMDDGFQNPTIYKNLSFLVIDEGFGFGNNKIIPAGPLRERVSEAISRADGIIVIKSPDGETKDFINYCTKPTIYANLIPSEESALFEKTKITAFCGIGRPNKFYSSIQSIGAEIVSKHNFSDHHNYTPEELMEIIEDSSFNQSTPVTTEKDWVRLPEEAKKMISYIKVDLVFTNSKTIYKMLDSII